MFLFLTGRSNECYKRHHQKNLEGSHFSQNVAIFEDLKSEEWKKQKWQNHIYGKVLKSRFNLHEMLHDFSSTVGPID